MSGQPQRLHPCPPHPPTGSLEKAVCSGRADRTRESVPAPGSPGPPGQRCPLWLPGGPWPGPRRGSQEKKSRFLKGGLHTGPLKGGGRRCHLLHRAHPWGRVWSLRAERKTLSNSECCPPDTGHCPFRVERKIVYGARSVYGAFCPNRKSKVKVTACGPGGSRSSGWEPRGMNPSGERGHAPTHTLLGSWEQWSPVLSHLRRGRTGLERRRGETPRESPVGPLPGPHKAPCILAHTPRNPWEMFSYEADQVSPFSSW